MARLVVESGQEAGLVYTVRLQPVAIGRSTECEIRVMDRRVSRRHALIRTHQGACVLEDLDSRNGTWLNHQLLHGHINLRSGDRIAVGGTVLLFEIDPADAVAKKEKLSRVRLTPTNEKFQTRTERSIASDTAPIISQEKVSREAMGDPMQRLRVIYQVSDSLRGELELETLLWKIMDIIWRVIIPHRGIIFISESIGGKTKLNPVVVKVRDDDDDEVIISQAILNKSLTDKTSILMTDAPSDVRFPENDSICTAHIRSAICSPLVAQGQSLGAIYVDMQDDLESNDHVFSNDDLDMMSGIAIQAALAIQNARLHHEALSHQRLEQELRIARDIQINLLPQGFPSIQGAELAAKCVPARQVGGDYYDFFPLTGLGTAIVVGDASGKGVPAAIFVSMLRTALRTQARAAVKDDLGAMMATLNCSVCSDALPDNYATLVILAYNPETRELNYTDAGHIRPIVQRADGSIEELTEGGCMLGVSDDQIYPQARTTLESGDILLLYTDGVTDTRNLRDDTFCREKLIENFIAQREGSATQICESIYQQVVRFRESNEAFDDLTLLVMKIT